MSWLALLFGGAFKKLWSIVSHASFAQIVAGVLTIVIIAQHFELKRSRAEAAKWHSQLIAIGQQSKVQQKEVTKTVDHYITVEKPVVRREVEKIETAPLPGNCRDPQEVLDADV